MSLLEFFQLKESPFSITIDNRFFFKSQQHAEALTRLRAEVRGLNKDARLDVAAFKARFGITRKFAIPLLEYLDRERVTRRVGDSRIVV